MPLDPTYRAPVTPEAIVDLKSRLIVAVLLFTTAPMSSHDGAEPVDGAARTPAVATFAHPAPRGFLE